MHRGWAWLLVLMFAGCGGPTAVPSGSAVVVATAPTETPPLREIWEAMYLQGSKVGYSQTTYQPTLLDGRQVTKIDTLGMMAFRRFGKTLEQTVKESFWVDDDGEIVRFYVHAQMGGVPQATTGVVSGTTATLQQGGPKYHIDWPRGTGGSTAVADSLRRKPMQPGETRQVGSFLAVFNRVAAITLTAKTREAVDVGGTRRELLRIVSQATIAGAQPIESLAWCDEAGEIWKSEFPALGQISVRTTKQDALAPASGPGLDLGTATLVPVAPPLVDAHRSQFVRYRVQLRDGDPATTFPASEGQVVRRVDDHTAEMDVRAVHLKTPLPPGFTPTPPTEADRKANLLVQSDDAAVRKLAAEAAAAGEIDAWTVARNCELLVHQRMRSVEFSQAFATAAETARSLTGDCTEHAVLLCALLRARGIPARTVIGLVYVEGRDAFGYHMWTQAWLNERWVPLDATLGRGGTSAAYLKVADTNLDGVDAYATLLPVFSILGRLKVEVMEKR